MDKKESAADPIVSMLVKKIVRAGQPERVILFGSRARGDFRPESDYDFLVIKDVAQAARRAYRRRICRSLFGVNVAKDVIVATPEEIQRFGSVIGTIYKPVLDEGIVVYERAA